MTNAYEELMKELNSAHKSIYDIDYCWFERWENSHTSRSWYSMDTNDAFSRSKMFEWLKKVEYDSWWWLQELFWEVVFKDWTWLERWEYDGSEWREYKHKPAKKDYKDFESWD